MDAAPRREMEKIYTSKDVHIPHSELVRLRQENRVSLGISELAADQIGVLSRLQPTKTTAAAAFRFWNIVLLAALVYSIYLSFTSAWWWFFVGIAVGLIIAKANSEANQRNLLDAAMVDPEFYEKVAALGGWYFKMSPEDAEPYLTDPVTK